MISDLFMNGSFLWTCAWQSTVMLTMGLIVSAILGKRRPGQAHYVLFVAMVTGVVLPPMNLAIKHLGFGFLASSNTQASQRIDILLTHSHLNEIWAFIAICLLGLLVLRIINDTIMISKARRTREESTDIRIWAATARFRVSPEPALYVSKYVKTPVIWSWGKRPEILIPLLAEVQISWMAVVCHELAHWSRHDHWWRLVSEVICCLLPWQPLVWIAKRKLVNLSEDACDDWVMAAGYDPAEYANTLLSLVPTDNSLLATPLLDSATSVGKRIRRILTTEGIRLQGDNSWLTPTNLLIICLAVIMACMQSPLFMKALTIIDKPTNDSMQNELIHIAHSFQDSSSVTCCSKELTENNLIRYEGWTGIWGTINTYVNNEQIWNGGISWIQSNNSSTV